jgi:hypothetical protein
MGVSSQLPRRAVYMSGSILLVVTPRGGNSSVRAGPILLFDSHQLRRQSWVIPGIFSRCGVYMNSPLLPGPSISSTWDFLAPVLASQLPTRREDLSQSSTSLHKPLPSSSTQDVWIEGTGPHRQRSLGGGFGRTRSLVAHRRGGCGWCYWWQKG